MAVHQLKDGRWIVRYTKGTLPEDPDRTRAKIKRRLRPYDFRHNFITAALEEGADIGAVAAIVGSSPETLRRHYQHVTNRLRRQTVALIKPIKEINR